MGKPSVIVRDLGYQKRMDELKKLGRYITVGVHANDSDREADEIDNVSLASIHEFGTADGRVPARSFLRATLDERAADIKSVRQKVLDAVVAGKITADQAMQILKEWIEAAVRKRIQSNIPPPLKPETIAAKGSSVALIDSGQLLNSIRSAVHDEKPKGDG